MAKLHGKLTHNSSHPYSKEALFILVEAARFEMEDSPVYDFSL
jgi:hypothetical protein